MKNIIAVCDKETEYACSLMEYMNSKNAFFMKAEAFSEEEAILDYGSSNKIDFLLISENMLNEKTASVRAKKRLVLSEKRFSDGSGSADHIYKYQSAENILKEVMSSYEAESEVLKNDSIWRERKKIIGVFSPVGGTGKTSFALALGQILSRQMPTLYVNLEAFSALEEILGFMSDGGLGDLLYYSKKPGSDPAARISAMIVTLQNLDIIPPVQSPEDFDDVSPSELIKVFSSVLSKTTYEALVLDIGCEVRGTAEVLDYCSKVYMPVREDPISKAKTEYFEGYIKTRISDLSKIEKLRLPFNTTSVLGKAYFENLIWSELGDFTRQLTANIK